MGSMLSFLTPKICVASYLSDKVGKDIKPILLVTPTLEQCDFLNSQIVANNDLKVYLNIDCSDKFCIKLALFIEAHNKNGFILTSEDLAMIQKISGLDEPPVVDYYSLLTHVIVGGDFIVNDSLIAMVLDSFKTFGYFLTTFGFMEGQAGPLFSSDNPSMISFGGYTQALNSEFVEVVTQNVQAGL